MIGAASNLTSWAATAAVQDLVPSSLLAEFTFWVVVGVTLLGALLAVGLKNIFHNVLGLALALFGVAGVFLFLGSPFVAVMEILIYVGAICIAIVFAVMLGRPLYLAGPPRHAGKTIITFAVSAMVFIALLVLILKTDWRPSPGWTLMQTFTFWGLDSIGWDVGTIGRSLLTSYALVFELISVVLLVAIIGAVLTAQRYYRRSETEDQPSGADEA
ncbi:MAG: NADH-quinone oxidoreductase subunit J [Proteobacteria bacterium]|nr:NADH-quinone oxidoreductase subunit J [Pseudomonadota bacterium]